MLDQDPQSTYRDGEFISRLYIDPLFRADKIPGKNKRAGFAVTNMETEETVIFPSIGSLINDEYPEISGGNPNIDHGICDLLSCNFSDKVQPVIHIDYLIETPTDIVKTKHKPICTDCYMELRTIVDNHLSEDSRMLANYLSTHI